MPTLLGLDLTAPIADPTILRHPLCAWRGHDYAPWRFAWHDGEDPHLAIWRCTRCHHEVDTAEGVGGQKSL